MNSYTPNLPNQAGYYWIRKNTAGRVVKRVVRIGPMGGLPRESYEIDRLYVFEWGTDRRSSLIDFEGYEFSRIEEPQ